MTDFNVPRGEIEWSRRAIINVVDVLAAHAESLTLIGADAVLLRTADLDVPRMPTGDGDLGVTPGPRRRLASIEELLTEAGYEHRTTARRGGAPPGRGEPLPARAAGGAAGLFAMWEPRVGREHQALKLRRMTSRWGTCNTKAATITLNTALAERPPEALEYVVVHELMHLIERGHGSRFKAGMDQLLLDWRARRRALRGPA